MDAGALPSPLVTGKAAVDLAVGQRNGRDDVFVGWLREACAHRGLSCEVLDETVVEEARAAICERRLEVRVLLDLTARWWNDDDPYVRLCYAVKDAGGRVIDDPDTAMIADHKAATHYRLQRAGLPVPPTVVLRRWTPDRELTAEEQALVGDRVVIKPAKGWGCKGVVLDARAEPSIIARARDFDRSDDFLVQRQIPYLWLEDDEGRRRPAWFRVFYLFGEVIPCWWHPSTGEYRHMSLREMWLHQLMPLARMIVEIARLTQMDFFSTEICLAEEEALPGTRYQALGHPFYAIDYVNDQCDLRVQSQDPSAPPDAVVRHLAGRFAELAWRHLRGLPLDESRSVWFRCGPGEDPTV